MLRAFLFLNAGLYGLLALWCTVRHDTTAQASGYVTLNASGHSEYLVIYGGLQWGLAGFYAWLGANPALHHTGAVFSVILYAPIVLYRLVTVGRFWPVSSLTLGIAGLEVALLLGAVWVLKRG